MTDPSMESIDTLEAFTPQSATEVPALLSRRSSLAALLGTVEEISLAISTQSQEEFEIVGRRLGVASSLFRALRAKHAPTANHCLRVALRCSFFGAVIELDRDQLDQLEIAALLHDIGKIGVPDEILTKPGPLESDEIEVMNRQWMCGLDILSASCGDSQIVDIVKYAPVRYDRRHVDVEELPIGARILKIADAYDAMTTDHVYRHAMPRERAISELFDNAGTQFDPVLVREFAKMSSHTEAEINQHISDRWLYQISSTAADTLWQLQEPIYANLGQATSESLFQQQLLDAMHDGVAFIDSSSRILLWNHGAERLTGISRQSVYEKSWNPQMLDMRDRENNQIRGNHCPIQSVIRTGVQSLRRITIKSQNGKQVTVDIHVIPVVDAVRNCYGATLLMHDASSESDLEERVQDLHEQATTDPLTSVANRAEFERVHQRLVDTSFANGTPSSLIICDIDRFKNINDVFGHQAGDQALIGFANLLQTLCRKGDLVARYGGEEFVILCPGCDNASAAGRAEEIRQQLSQTPQEALDGRCMTASFGVTELQLGDTTETMLRRADRALYQAKDSGRNRVIQLGAGILVTEETPKPSWFAWMRSDRKKADALVTRTLIANVPLNLIAEKIRGFIADHAAEVKAIEDDRVELKINTSKLRSTESRFANILLVEMNFREQPRDSSSQNEKRKTTRTFIDVKIAPQKNKDRRTDDHGARQILASLKSYLIAQDYFME